MAWRGLGSLGFKSCLNLWSRRFDDRDPDGKLGWGASFLCCLAPGSFRVMSYAADQEGATVPFYPACLAPLSSFSPPNHGFIASSHPISPRPWLVLQITNITGVISDNHHPAFTSVLEDLARTGETGPSLRCTKSMARRLFTQQPALHS
jgi:hypothetical protein